MDKLERTILYCIIFLLIGVSLYSIYKSLPKEPEDLSKIILAKGVESQIKGEFNSLSTEKVYCLTGKIVNGTAHISGFYYGETYASSSESISGRCNNDIIGTIHNHENGVCQLSMRDVYTFGKTRDNLIGVVCGPDTISFFTPESLELKKSYEVSA